MAVEVYLDLMSQPCRAVHILLDCTRIPHKLVLNPLCAGENRTPDFAKLNPMYHDAILKYLASRADVPQHWYPRQPERRARVDEYTAWHHSNTRPHAAKVFMLEVSDVDQVLKLQERLIRALSQLDDTLDKLETMFLRRQPFLCGDDVTVADLLAVCELMQPLGGGRDVLQARPQLRRWRSKVQAAVGDVLDSHTFIGALGLWTQGHRESAAVSLTGKSSADASRASFCILTEWMK
uniref:glutathione transferase n=1 Tax=Mastacembelus armatus TaxID=205130 RepID=A0A7N9APK0_9TELE